MHLLALLFISAAHALPPVVPLQVPSMRHNVVVGGQEVERGPKAPPLDRTIRLASVRILRIPQGAGAGEAQTICSGTLLNGGQVATAAHCLPGQRYHNSATEKYVVEITRADGTKRRVEIRDGTAAVDPRSLTASRRPNLSKDLAILNLAEDTGQRGVPICGAEAKPSEGRLVAAGIGISNEDPTASNSSPLRMITIENAGLIPSGELNGRPRIGDGSICMGDSGGGLYYNNGTSTCLYAVNSAFQAEKISDPVLIERCRGQGVNHRFAPLQGREDLVQSLGRGEIPSPPMSAPLPPRRPADLGGGSVR